MAVTRQPVAPWPGHILEAEQTTADLAHFSHKQFLGNTIVHDFMANLTKQQHWVPERRAHQAIFEPWCCPAMPGMSTDIEVVRGWCVRDTWCTARCRTGMQRWASSCLDMTSDTLYMHVACMCHAGTCGVSAGTCTSTRGGRGGGIYLRC